VVVTKPTRDLSQVLMADYVRLAQERGARLPYAQTDIDHYLKRTEIIEYNEWNRKGQGNVRFQEAGHILGSAVTELKLSRDQTLVYTGDLYMRESRLLEPAERHYHAQHLIIESTYGSAKDRHPNLKETGQHFVNSINQTLDKGGIAVVPTFATGRGQEILFTLENFLRSGSLRKVPIFIDGMVNKMLRIYRHNAIYLKREMQRRILTSEEDPFKSPHFHVPERKDRRDVFEQAPCIVLTTSGMLNGGPVLRYLEELGPDPKNKLILVGYQAEGTRGRSILEGERSLDLGKGRRVNLRMQVEKAPFTAHADQHELVEFARGIRGLKKCYIVHGEPEKSQELAQAIEKATAHGGHPGVTCEVPEIGEEFELRL
jgi:predicted metal-dependent RNase